jgi:diguanylate cyclase
MGVSEGSGVLRGVADAIRHTRRETDFGVRWGGDELAIIAPSTAQTAAERLGQRRLLHVKRQTHAGAARPSVSVGLAVLEPTPDRAESIECR